MDNTQIYFSMCSESVETQEVVEPQLYDLVKCDGEVRRLQSDINYPLYIHDVKRAKSGLFVWECLGKSVVFFLQQDQLQDMIESKNKYYLIWKFYEFAMGIGDINWSMEMYWLAFVMHNKYGKMWDGEEWIKSP